MNHISKTSKLKSIDENGKAFNVNSWSLPALKTCLGSKDENGEIVPICKKCYATKGFYVFGCVKKTREENIEAWKCDSWVADMIDILKKEKYFRWFDSGDLYSLDLAEKIYSVMVETPNCYHWLPTKMFKFSKFYDILNKMQALKNVMVRFSSDSIDGSFIDGIHGSVVIPHKDFNINAYVCPATKNKTQCGVCKACYDKNIPVIAYVLH